MMKQAWLRLIVFSLVYWAILKTRPAIESAGNAYSLRHNNYNEIFFNLQVQLNFLMIIGMYTLNNFGIRFGVNCLDKLLLLVLMVLRLCMLIYLFKELFPVIIEVCKLTYHLNEENWWTNPDEPFFTNCSAFNAFICWFAWSITRFYIFFFMYVLPVIMVYAIFKKPSWRSWGAHLCKCLEDTRKGLFETLLVGYLWGAIAGTLGYSQRRFTQWLVRED